MKFLETEIPGVVRILPEPFIDQRGTFSRLYCPKEFSDAGLDDFKPVQINLSRNVAMHTLRGLHWQDPPHAEAKLVRVTCGAIWDVAVDLRPDSPTRLQWAALRLDASSAEAFFIPEGFAHGFLTLEPDTDVLYQVSHVYAPGSERGARWDDPAFSIDWPARPAVISDRDRAYSDFVG